MTSLEKAERIIHLIQCQEEFFCRWQCQMEPCGECLLAMAETARNAVDKQENKNRERAKTIR